MLIAAWALYVAGLAVTIGAATQTFAKGLAAVAVLVCGIAVFAVGIVVEMRASRV